MGLVFTRGVVMLAGRPTAVRPKVAKGPEAVGAAIAEVEWDAIDAAVIRAVVVVARDSTRPRTRVRSPTSHLDLLRGTNHTTRRHLSVKRCA